MKGITLENIAKLTPEEQEFMFEHGAKNCLVVKFSEDFIDILYDYFGEGTYDEEDIKMLESLSDGKWHLMYTDDDEDYFLCGDDNLVFVDDCFEETSDNLCLLIDQK